MLEFQFCYADRPVKIKKAYLYKVMASGIEIADFSKGVGSEVRYAISFAAISGCTEPFFNITDKNLFPLDASVQQEVKSIFLSDLGSGSKLFSYIVYSSAIDGSKLEDSRYTIDFGKAGEENCEEIEGAMPEIQISLSDIQAAKDGAKSLKIKNVSSKKIVITRILREKVNKAISVESSIDTVINIFVGQVHNIVLKPVAICASENEKGIYKLEMEYVVDGKSSENKFVIEIGYSCESASDNEEAKQVTEKIRELKTRIENNDMRKYKCNTQDSYYGLCRDVGIIYQYGYEDGKQFCGLEQLEKLNFMENK